MDSLITKAKAIMTQIATISHWDEPISEYDAQSNGNNRKNIACFQMKYTLLAVSDPPRIERG